MKKLKAFEKALMHWTIENPRQYRVIVTVTLGISFLVQMRGLRDETGGVRIASAVLAIMLIGIYAMLVSSWRRQDLLDELRLLVGEQTDDLGLLGNVAWFWGYHAPTRTVREIVVWLRTHNIARTPADDMPQPVTVLVHVLTEAL